MACNVNNKRKEYQVVSSNYIT